MLTRPREPSVFTEVCVSTSVSAGGESLVQMNVVQPVTPVVGQRVRAEFRVFSPKATTERAEKTAEDTREHSH